MAIFEFDLTPVEDIVPWGTEDSPSLSWYALTDGRFRMPLGDQVLFQYTDEIQAHWKIVGPRDADYQIAAFVREMLGSVAAGTARLPRSIERLASNWGLLTSLQAAGDEEHESDVVEGVDYTAWHWLGERSPWASYLVASPSLHFVRIGDDVHIRWDNRDRVVDGVSVWTAQYGVHTMSVEAFRDECRDLAGRLLGVMDRRIADIENGIARPQVRVSTASLREQHETWRHEFSSYFADHEPDVDWQETERALRVVLERRGLTL